MENNTSKSSARVLMVLPTLGQRLDLLKETLDSVRMQSIPHDIVMIFPLKNKAAVKMANEYNAMTVDDPGSISTALNVGMRQAKSHHEFIGWIGDDDLLSPGSLEAAVKSLDAAPRASAAFGHCDYIDNEGNKLFTNRAGKLAPWIMTWGPNLVPCPGAVFRKSALDVVGEFDETNKYSMDLDMFLRLRKIGNLVAVDRIQASFRWHPTSTTVSNRLSSIKESESVKRKHLPKLLRPFSPLWHYPVRIATIIAARRVNAISAGK